jgi:hypothetical protein
MKKVRALFRGRGLVDWKLPAALFSLYRPPTARTQPAPSVGLRGSLRRAPELKKAAAEEGATAWQAVYHRFHMAGPEEHHEGEDLKAALGALPAVNRP